MTFRRRINLILALTGACASAAMADVVSFEGPQYVVGGGLNLVVDNNGNTWEKEGTDARDFVVDGTVISPLANALVGGVSTKSIRFDFDGNGTARLGLDLANPTLTGIVTLQYDYRNDVRAAGNNLMRVAVLNTAGTAPGGVIGATATVWQPFAQNGGAFAAAQNGFFGIGGEAGANRAFGVFGDCRGQAPAFPDIYCNNAFSPQLFPEAQGANDRWYRVKYWFDLSDTMNAGRLLYAAIYDISCGSEIQIAEHHIVNQLVPIKKFNDAGASEVRAIQLRAGGGDAALGQPIDQRMWLDNFVLAADPSFTPPAPLASPPVAATTLNADAGAQAVTTAFTLPTTAGDTPSIARSGSTFYTSDSSNGLTTWTGGASSTFTDDMLETEFDSNGTGVLVADAGGSLLVVANGAGSPGAGWRDLMRYDSGTGTWSIVCDGDVAGNTGNHSASLLTFGGTDHVIHAWTGGPEYPSLNANGTRGPALLNVGNRWAGATTEFFADNTAGNQMLFLQQTDAAGTPISNNLQAYNGIYRAGYGVGCDAGNTLRARVSPTARLLPWVTNAPDGGNVNRHNMEFEPARNRVWVLRAGTSNEIGIYDIAQDRYGILKVNRPGGAALAMDRADLQLSADGSQMYILIRGEPAVYGVSTNVIFVNTGACISGATCTLLTAAACATAGGTYLGDNQVCPPPGACCNGTTCTIAFQVTCTAGGGSFQGAGTVCQDYNVGAGGAFEDIFATGTAITTGDDDSTSIPIGFSFTHYGNTYTDVRVGANGYLSFSGTDGAESWVPRLGNAMEPNNVIAGLWTDLSPQCAAGGLKSEVRGSVPNRRLIVQWTNVSQYTGDCTPIDANTFQIVLFETTNNSEVRLGDLNNPSTTPLPAYQTGLENGDGSQSEIVATASIVDNAVFQFAPTPNPCLCPADFNNSGTVSVQDIFDFLAAYFSGNPSADVNNSGTVSVQDIFDYLALYFAGC